jgi:hypothetical protein
MKRIVIAMAFATVALADPEPLSPDLPSPPPYRYRQTTLLRKFDSAYALTRNETKVEDVYPVEGRMYFHRLVMKDGKPVSPEKQAKEDKREEEFREAIRKGFRPKHAEEMTDLSTRFATEELERAFLMEEVGREILNGRPCVIYKYQGRPGRRLHVGGQYQEFFDIAVDVVQGRLWLDEAEKQPARVEVRLKRPATLMFGLLVWIKQVKIDVEWVRLDSGVWWPREAEGYVDARYYIIKSFVMHGRVVNDGFAKLPADARTARAADDAPPREQKH